MLRGEEEEKEFSATTTYRWNSPRSVINFSEVVIYLADGVAYLRVTISLSIK